MKNRPFLKYAALKFVAAIFIVSSLITFTTCNIIFPDYIEYVVIAKAEWGLFEDASNHTFQTIATNYTFSDTLVRKSLEVETDNAFRNTLTSNNERAYWNTRRIQAALNYYTSQGYTNIRLEQGNYYVGGREGIVWAEGNQNWRNPEMIRIQPRHSGLRFDLGGSTIRLEPHDRMESRIIWLYSEREQPTKDIKIFNGTLIGDRINHRFEDTKDGKQMSHEWGTGIDIWGDVHNVELYNLTIKEVTGDCIGANGFNITIRDCDISRGRRNGIVSVYCNGLTIFNNKIHCIYNAGEAWDSRVADSGNCKYCTAAHPNSQREYFGSGIGAEACIAFEHTSNPYFDKQINIKIYNNWLDGQKPRRRTVSPERTYYMDNAINFHWATYATWIYNNDIVGDFEWSCGGSNTLIENNRFLGRGYKGYSVSKGLVASGPILETGRSAANYVVIRNNYFKNYNVIVGGASGGVSDSRPHWRHDYAIVDNVLVYDEPRVSNNNYWTSICASVNNTVVMGNVFDVRTDKPIACAIYIDVVDSSWEKRIPDNLKVDMYISGNTFKGPIWRQKHYYHNSLDRDLGNAPQYEPFTDSRMPGNYSETNNYSMAYDMYREILRKTQSVGNIWGRTR